MPQKFATKLRRPSVIRIDEVTISDMQNYLHQLVNYLLYENHDSKSDKQHKSDALIYEIRATEAWIKKNSRVLI